MKVFIYNSVEHLAGDQQPPPELLLLLLIKAQGFQRGNSKNVHQSEENISDVEAFMPVNTSVSAPA